LIFGSTEWRHAALLKIHNEVLINITSLLVEEAILLNSGLVVYFGYDPVRISKIILGNKNNNDLFLSYSSPKLYPVFYHEAPSGPSSGILLLNHDFLENKNIDRVADYVDIAEWLNENCEGYWNFSPIAGHFRFESEKDAIMSTFYVKSLFLV